MALPGSGHRKSQADQEPSDTRERPFFSGHEACQGLCHDQKVLSWWSGSALESRVLAFSFALRIFYVSLEKAFSKERELTVANSHVS